MNKPKLLVADLDNTLAESKQPMSLDMAEILEKILEKLPIAVISGGSYTQYQRQFLGSLPIPDNLLENLFLFPTSGSAFYRYEDKKWIKIYSEDLSEDEKKQIFKAFEFCFEELDFEVPKKPLYGPILEDRLSQITFSALGQQAPLNLKKKWDPTLTKRLEMVEVLQRHLIGFEIKVGGSSSIDISKIGCDKSYGIKKICEIFNVGIEDLIYIGDSFSKNGNDQVVKQMGVPCHEVSGPEDTMVLLKDILAKCQETT